MRIDIISDTICPWCFVGKRRLAQALQQRPDLEADITWRPFQLNPDMPRQGMEREHYLTVKFGSEANSVEIYARVAEAGQSEGIAFNFAGIARTPNTLDSHRLIHWAGAAGADIQDQVVEQLFSRYFLGGQDIGAHDTLIEIARDAGMDSAWVAETLTGDTDLDLVRREDQFAREIGVGGVPFFILDSKYAISGAQAPAVLLKAFEQVAAEAVSGDAGPAAL
jgi:predicted DsbA family dithiol-disulfide isomerase